MFPDGQHGGCLLVRAQGQLFTVVLDGVVGMLEAELVVPEHARGIALFTHGSISHHGWPCDEAVARGLERSAFATLLLDLLTDQEVDENLRTGRYALDLELFVGRLVAVTRWLAASPRTAALPIGYVGAGAGAAAALAAAAAAPDHVAAVISCGGRVDLLERATLARVQAPVLLIEGTAEGGPRACEKDERVLAMSRSAQSRLPCARLVLVHGATHWLADPGAFAVVTQLAADWFGHHLVARASAMASVVRRSSRAVRSAGVSVGTPTRARGRTAGRPRSRQGSPSP